MLERFISAFVIALSFAGCDGDTAMRDARLDVGATEISVPLVLDDITSIVATISAPDMAADIVGELGIANGTASAVFAGIPVGAGRAVMVRAYAGEQLVCSGGTNVDILAGERAIVAVTLQCDAESVEVGELGIAAELNVPPSIWFVLASPSRVTAGETLQVRAVVSDGDGDTLAYLWSASAGSFADSTMPETTWIAPQTAGEYDITIDVSDGLQSASYTVSMTVSN